MISLFINKCYYAVCFAGTQLSPWLWLYPTSLWWDVVTDRDCKPEPAPCCVLIAVMLLWLNGSKSLELGAKICWNRPKVGKYNLLHKVLIILAFYEPTVGFCFMAEDLQFTLTSKYKSLKGRTWWSVFSYKPLAVICLIFFKLSVGWLMWSSSTWPLVQLLSASTADGFPSRWVLAHSTAECCQTGWTKSNTFGKVLQNCQAPLGLFRLGGQSLSFGTRSDRTMVLCIHQANSTVV